MGGDFVLARFTAATGQVDTTFGGGDGIVRTDVRGTSDRLTRIARTSDGRLVAAGTAGSLGFASTRHLLAEGTTAPPLPPAPVPVYVTGRTLFVDGTAGIDVIDLRLDASSVTAIVNGFRRVVAPTAVDAVSVRGFADNDIVGLVVDANPSNVRVTLAGGDGHDDFTVRGSAPGVLVRGEGGGDEVRARGGGDIAFVFDGGAEWDGIWSDESDFLDLRRHIGVESGSLAGGTIIGTDSTNQLELTRASGRIEGLGGNDFLSAVNGNAVLLGGAGDDELLGGAGNDGLFGGSGNDRLDGRAGNDYLEAGDDNDTLTGGTGTDTLKGQAGDDWLYGRDSIRDTLDGGSGTDRAQRDRDLDYLLSFESFV